MSEFSPIVIPVFCFLALLLGISLYATYLSRRNHSFQSEYFIAGRSLGGVVLALTLVATYGSVSSFVSGPGVAWQRGFGWVVFAAPQIITGFFLLGVLGKKLALIGRRIGALTITDVIKERYQSKALCVLLSVMLLLFFTAMIVGQFIGGAQIFSAITGWDYRAGVLLFAAVTVLYTSSGFRTVVLTDALCAVLMLIGMVTMGYSIIEAGGSLEHIMERLSQEEVMEDGVSRLFTPNSGGLLPWTLLLSAWLLVGFCTLGLPQSLVRCLSYKQSSDLSRAMLVATLVCGALMIGMTTLGVLARGVITELPAQGTDAVIPNLIVHHMSPLLAGITIVGPIAATMSTVSSLLIAASSAVIRDLGVQFDLPAKLGNRGVKVASIITTAALGVIAIALSLHPYDIVVWVNMFAFGGLECTFMWPVVLGLFWWRMNKQGAILGVAGGLLCYVLMMALNLHIGSWHNIVPGILVGLICSLLGTYLGGRPPVRILRIFFPGRLLLEEQREQQRAQRQELRRAATR
ncbi:MAG: sodium/pantothenate symporter [Succinivibrio sp.]|nr:sodium/pantothenate symporter [Succinivibrio sp.]